MTRDELQKSAEFYSRIDKLAFLVKATFEFDQASGHLISTYVVDCDIEEADDCELIDGEIVAAFPEIRSAQSNYVRGGRQAGVSEIEVVTVLR